MEQVATILEREADVLENLLFKLVETGLLLEAGEARFLPRATREVDRARTRAREVGLLRATTVARIRPGVTLRDLATDAPLPWPAILRDHHQVLGNLVGEVELVGHRNALAARTALDELRRTPVGVGAVQGASRPIRDAELDRLARGAALEAVLRSAARLHMPDVLDFLR